MSKLFGIATVNLNGKTLNTKPGASLDWGGVERTTEETDQGIGFTETKKAAVVDCEIVFGKGTSLKEMSEADDVTITFTTDIGSKYILANAWLSTPPKVTGGSGGGVPLTFTAPKAEEANVGAV